MSISIKIQTYCSFEIRTKNVYDVEYDIVSRHNYKNSKTRNVGSKEPIS